MWKENWQIYMIKGGLCVCLSVCMYPSSAHSFGPMGMKLGMDNPWDPGKAPSGQKVKKIFFFAFLCVSEHFQSIETNFFLRKLCEREARSSRERSDNVGNCIGTRVWCLLVLYRQTDSHSYCSKNITPPPFHGGVKSRKNDTLKESFVFW